ncbi:protein dispatched-like 1 isoform X1 [Silurus meridionalis]|nr:protein dispatched-like 1 isoform X1 [Silurus meridionalis]
MGRADEPKPSHGGEAGIAGREGCGVDGDGVDDGDGEGEGGGGIGIEDEDCDVRRYILEAIMALTEASMNLLSSNNGGVPQISSTPSDPSSSVPATTPETNAKTSPRTERSCQSDVTQNLSVQTPSRSSAFSSRPESPKLLSSSLSHHSSACCSFQEPECCNRNQQDTIFQGGVHSGRALHIGPCCVQGTPIFRMHHQWQERFQNQPNMNTFSPARPFRFPKSYSELIADWPVVVLSVCTILIVVCTLVGVLVPDLPDFSDPLLGFEPRGTTIGQRLVTWNNMVKNTGYKATLANYPFKYADEQAKSHQEERYLEDHLGRDKRQAEWDFSKDSFFCDVPGDSYSRIVFTSADGKNLWNLHAIKSMCNFDNTRVRSHPQYWSLCQRATSASCCPSWTLGNYIAVLTNKSSCQKITERDVSLTLKVLRSCAKYYYNGTLGPECWDVSTRRKDQFKCGGVPRKCTKYNAVYHILHFLVDKDFLHPKSLELHPPDLKYSMLFSPTEKGESMMDIYLDNFENWNSTDGITTVTGIEFGIKHNLFQDYLLTDTMYPAIAIVIVLVVMCVYTKSVFITIMTMFAIMSSLIISYVLYRVVFNFEFFPFMNLTALIILVGIGADDAFVLCDVWNYTKIDKPNSQLAETVNVTLQHAALSMFVTSFTTAAAFYANYVSNITAIRCFGVYAGTAILVNYVLMVTWLPAVVVLHERYLLNIFICFRSPPHTTSFLKSIYQITNKCLFALSEWSRVFFEKVLPCIVIKLRYLWLFWFLVITGVGAYIVCVSPKIKLPSLELSEFQVFRSTHPFERYDAEYKKLFMFERVHHGEDLHMPITIIWGVIPIDTGDPMNPKNKGKLTLDTSFNIASPASQVWILNFCQKLRNQSFVFQSNEQDFTSCFIETFKQWMENQDCDEARVYPCCSQSTFPYKQDVFELCIKRAIMELDRSTVYHLDSKTPGPRFDINDTIRAIVLEFHSTYHFTLAYEKMHLFYHEVDSWIQEELKNAPDGLSYGWFVSNLEFYDLQDSLSDGTLIAMALSVAVAFSVMLLTTWNIIISLYAIISIAGTIFVTVGSLVLLGWELNILESVTISVAVGLSVDFAVHYGVAYRLAPEPDREGKVIFSLSRMGSAIAMAALTTFVAGAMMMPSTVLAYTQLGTFLMLIMCISWAFSTFFFQCMCRCVGPQGSCGQIPMPKLFAKCRAFKAGTSDSSSTYCEGGKTCQTNKYQSDTRGQVVEYELEPLATQNTEKDEVQKEHTQLTDEGAPQHASCCQKINKSEINDTNTMPNTDPVYLHNYSYNSGCPCGHYLPQWTNHHTCMQDKECPCLAATCSHAVKDWTIFSKLNNANHTTTNHDVHCVPTQFHKCPHPPTARSNSVKKYPCYRRGCNTLHHQSQDQSSRDAGANGSHLNSPCKPPPDAITTLNRTQRTSAHCSTLPRTPKDCVADDKSEDTSFKVSNASVLVQDHNNQQRTDPATFDRSVQFRITASEFSPKRDRYVNGSIKVNHKESNGQVVPVNSASLSESLC